MHDVVCQTVPKARRRAWPTRARANRNAAVSHVKQCETSGIGTHGTYLRRALPRSVFCARARPTFTRHMLSLEGSGEAEKQRLDGRKAAWEVTWDLVDVCTCLWVIA
jgi:hypothetical protein